MMLFLVSVACFCVGTLIYVKQRRKNASEEATKLLHRPNWERDLVYLVQFPVSPHVRTISPFSMKLETWLLLNNVPYENVYSSRFSKKGQIPYVELNGEQIPDSNVVIGRLKTHFKVECDDSLSKEQHAVGHAVSVMLENHTAPAGAYWRYGYHMEEFTDKLMENFRGRTGMFFFRFVLPFVTRLKSKAQGIGRHSLDEVADFTFQDIKALSDLLGEKDFLFDTPRPTTYDCVVFGHLAQFLYIPMDFPQKEYMKQSCTNLIAYVDRMRSELWPNWEFMCTAKCMEGKMGRDYQNPIGKSETRT